MPRRGHLVAVVLVAMAVLASAAAGAGHVVAVAPLVTYAEVNAPRDGFHLCMSRADGTRAQTFGGRRWAPGSASWSPDGKYLALQADTHSVGYYGSPHNTDVFIVSERGRVVRNLTKRLAQNNIFDAAWSPNGRWIAFSVHTEGPGYSANDLWIVHPDATGFRSLHLDGGHPSWSPNSRSIAYNGSDGGFPTPHAGIFVATAGGANARLVIPNGFDPSWSPDGRAIAYAATTVPGSGKHDLFLAQSDGSNPRNLTNTPDADETPAGWSPGSKLILYTRSLIVADHQSVEVRVMHADGTHDHRVAENATALAWRPATPLSQAKHRTCSVG